ncbi:hypothetical protein GA0115247_11321, partial [Streptomyces sp. PalvLS-984]
RVQVGGRAGIPVHPSYPRVPAGIGWG